MPLIGLKLDFKTMKVVESAMKTINILAQSAVKQLQSNGRTLESTPLPHSPFLPPSTFHSLLWLNADIIQGPTGKSPSIDPHLFLTTCTKHASQAVLSIGWTTGKITNEEEYSLYYTDDMIESMLQLCDKFNLQQVTFPLRCCFMPTSWKHGTIQKLLDFNSNYSLTIWTSKSDQMRKAAIEEEKCCKHTLPSERTFLDLHLGF